MSRAVAKSDIIVACIQSRTDLSILQSAVEDTGDADRTWKALRDLEDRVLRIRINVAALYGERNVAP